jgi:hypothetical protein
MNQTIPAGAAMIGGKSQESPRIGRDFCRVERKVLKKHKFEKRT